MVQIQNISAYKTEPLSMKETMILLTQAQKGCKESREKIILANIKLVYSMLQRFKGNEKEQEDLFQIGIIGLIKCINRFDVNKKVAFSTYAVPTIIGEMKTYLRKNQKIKISRTLRANSLKIKKIREDYFKTHGSDMTLSQVAEKLGMEEEEVLLSMLADEQVTSLSQEINDEHNDHSLVEILPADTLSEEQWVSHIGIQEGLKGLSARECFIIENRYFKDKTQSEIAEEIGVSQVQISRIEKKALKKMRKAF